METQITLLHFLFLNIFISHTVPPQIQRYYVKKSRRHKIIIHNVNILTVVQMLAYQLKTTGEILYFLVISSILYESVSEHNLLVDRQFKF